MDKIVNSPPPDISVVMSVYNAEKYLREAIDSILQQSFREFEFIIVNDGSKDSSLSIIQSYNDPRIRLIDNEGNKGLIYSLNTAFENSNGTYIARMDADDISLPERLQKQYTFLESNSSIGVCSGYYTQFSATKEISYTAFTDHHEIASNLLFNSSIIHPSLMLRKAVVMQLPVLFDSGYKHAEDYELWSRLIFKCRFSAVPELILRYRLHAQQVTQKNHVEQMESADRVRRNLLIHAGFHFTEDELRVHCLLGNSRLLTAKSDVLILEQWFKKLIEQNKTLKWIDQAIFEKTIRKHWLDACGMTNLGLPVFFRYLGSELRDKKNESIAKLFVKCLVRQFQ